eukprot:COSAG05_NODE_1366_length_5062_cov_15.988762_5_plen_399_part_01
MHASLVESCSSRRCSVASILARPRSAARPSRFSQSLAPLLMLAVPALETPPTTGTPGSVLETEPEQPRIFGRHDDSTSSDDEDWLDVLADASAVADQDVDACASAGSTGIAEKPAVSATNFPPAMEAPLQQHGSDSGARRMALSCAWVAAILPSGDAAISGVELRDTPARGLGFFATETLRAGHSVLRLGRSLVITQQRAIAACEQFYGVGSLMDALSCPATTSLAIYLIVQRAQHLLPMTQAPDAGSLGAWVATLPGYARLDGIPSLEDPEDETLVEDVLEATRRLKRQLLSVYDWIDTYIWQRPGLAPYLPREIFSARALRWAMGMILSRGFELCGSKILLPLIDWLNHAPVGTHELNCEKQYDATGAIMIRTTRQVERNEELCICYSETDSPEMML